MAKQHNIYEPGAGILIAGQNDGASVTDLQTGRVSDKVNNGQPYTVVTIMGTCLGGEPVTITVPGTVARPTAQEVAMQVGQLNFFKAKFKNLVLEAKGGQYNRVEYVGTAEAVEFIAPPGTSKT